MARFSPLPGRDEHRILITMHREFADDTAVPDRLTPHPGELLREMLAELGISQTTFHERTGMSMQRISEIINGKRGISPETAWILGSSFGQTPMYWMNLQALHDLTRLRPREAIPPMPEAVRAAGDQKVLGDTQHAP